MVSYFYVDSIDIFVADQQKKRATILPSAHDIIHLRGACLVSFSYLLPKYLS